MSEKTKKTQETALTPEQEAQVEQMVDQIMQAMPEEAIMAQGATEANPVPKLVQDNSTIEIRYKLNLMDGTLVDETEGDETFTFKLGEGHMLNKLEALLVGLEIGTTGTFIIQPEQAFGEPDPINIHTLRRSEFPPEMDLKEKMVIGFEGPDGSEIPGWIMSVEAEEVVVDFNHPLSGQTIQFEATIVDIKD